MNKPLSLVATLALLGASLFPVTVSAESSTPTVTPRAICTQMEPIYRRNGVSYYAGTGMCEVIAEMPDAFGWMAVPLDPESSGMAAVCSWFMNSDHVEYAVAWAQPGYQSIAAEYCYNLRRGGVDITFADKDYS